jgi:hypothetical protein
MFETAVYFLGVLLCMGLIVFAFGAVLSVPFMIIGWFEEWQNSRDTEDKARARQLKSGNGWTAEKSEALQRGLNDWERPAR